jgi:hypothetical protein
VDRPQLRPEPLAVVVAVVAVVAAAVVVVAVDSEHSAPLRQHSALAVLVRFVRYCLYSPIRRLPKWQGL